MQKSGLKEHWTSQGTKSKPLVPNQTTEALRVTTMQKVISEKFSDQDKNAQAYQDINQKIDCAIAFRFRRASRRRRLPFWLQKP